MTVRCRAAAGSRRRLAGLVVALIVAALPTPASAAAATSYVVTARRSGSVDITFASAFTLDMGRTSISGAGSFAGYYLQPLTGAPDAGHGEITVNAFSHPPYRRFVFPLGNREALLTYTSTRLDPEGTRRRLGAGRYRLHVLADAPTRLTLALDGRRGRRALTATGVTRFVGAVRDLTPAVAGRAVPVPVVADLPFHVRSPESLTFLGIYFVHEQATEATPWSANHCLGEPDVPARCQGGRPADDAPGWDVALLDVDQRVHYPTPVVDAAFGYMGYYRYGTARPGARAANYYVASTAPVRKVVVAAFSLTF